MRSGAALALLLVLGSTGGCVAEGGAREYFGLSLGPLSELHHGVRGRVYAVDSRTLYLRDFHYDGEGPAAFFYVGTSKTPHASGGTRLRDERGGAGALRRYRGEGVTLALPDGKTLRDVAWFAVWCDEYSVNFGSVSIPRSGEFPRPAKLGALRGVHGVSSDPLVVVDAQTLLLPNFSYDGEAPDAKFWVGRGEKPSPAGIRIPDENGKEAPLRKYDRKTIVLTLPGELTVFDIGHFAVWCEAFTVNFGHVPLPAAQLANVPPSLKMLGVSPQSKLNCEVLHDELAFEVRWAVAGDSIVLQLVAKLEDGEYMSFGISGDARHSQMVGADVAVAWVDKRTLKGYAVDYYLDAKSQCAGVRGSCPDERLGEKTNSVRLLNAALVNGYSIVTYQRSLHAADELDRPVLTNGSQPIVWALGPLNSRDEVSYHHHFTKGDKLIEFGRPPVWNCPMPESEEVHAQHGGSGGSAAPTRTTTPSPVAPPARRPSDHEPADDNRAVVIKPNPVPTPAPAPKAVPWEIPAIQCHEPPDGVFYAQMGPTGGKQGYSAITGHVGWGISWYINGLLIPEVNVVRGRKYTFVVEGGSDPEVPARYHPFYITNDPVGGYYHKTDEEKKGVEIYAGVRRSRSGAPVPTGVGRLCNWTPDQTGPEADEFPSFGAYQRSLTLVCEEGSPGVVTWTPDRNTPDTVYYQCFTHRYLGWKINVVDSCDEPADGEGQESRLTARLALPEDLEQEESVQVHSRVKPDSNFIDHRRKTEKIINTKTNYNDFSSDKGDVGHMSDIYRPQPDRNQYPQEFEMPISNGQIRDVIQAVESLESRMKESIQRNSSSAMPHRTAPPAGRAPSPPAGRGPPSPTSRVPEPGRYEVYEEVRESLPERPLREDDEYDVEGRSPEYFFLPHNQKPLTLQSVLRPGTGGPNKQPNNSRPQFRRPVPPEIKLRRPPPPPFHKHNNGFPLPMPNGHGPHGMSPIKPLFNRMPPNMNRSPPGTPPMKAMPPLHHHKPIYNQGPPKQAPKLPSGPVQSIIMGKPNLGNIQLPSQSQTLSLGRTDLIANKVVKSQITLPGSNDAIAQASIPSSVIFQPGQIILGKPMDNPVPLDQQMTQTRHKIMRIPNTPTPAPESQSTTQGNRPGQIQSYSDIQSSDFIGESTDTSSIPPAVNTGFRPNTIVIESGFKPIIREPLMDRVGDFDEENSNRREDTDVVEDYEQSPQYISNHAYHTPSDKITETFEPMFIPSPPDHLLATNHKTKEVFPSNHAKEDRPHPVYIKTETDMNTLFSKDNMDKEVPSDMVMESDIVSPQYLPPDPKLPKEHSQKLATNDETFTTYDGKTVSAATLTSISDMKQTLKLFSSKLPSNTELLLKSPQFGPFKGDIPPPLEAHVSKGSNKESGADNRTTHLKLVNVYRPDDKDELELKAEGSEHHEVTEESEYDQDNEYELKNDETDEDQEQVDQKDGDDKQRIKRDTKATQFERGEVEEQTTSKSKSVTKNHIEFQSRSGASRSPYWTNLVVLVAILCLKFF